MRPSDYRRTAWLDTVVAKSDKLNNCQKSKLKCEESSLSVVDYYNVEINKYIKIQDFVCNFVTFLKIVRKSHFCESCSTQNYSHF